MKKVKNIVVLFALGLSSLLYSQKEDKPLLEVELAYLKKAKADKTSSHISEELFLLQITKDKAYFFGENMAKNDSILRNDIHKAFVNGTKGREVNIVASSRRSAKYSYTIVQSSEGNSYFEGYGKDAYFYKEDIIKDWKLLEESKMINNFNCKKVTLNYKGRTWEVWYDESVPLPYGPYKFTGLPGLVVKIESQDGEYSFELVKSTPKNKLNGKTLSLDDFRYKKAIPVTFAEMRRIKKNKIERLVAEASSLGIETSAENIRSLLERQKERLKNFENENLIEKTE